MPTSNQTVTHYKWDEMPRETVSPMLDRRLITGDRMMLAHVYLKKGCIVPKHQHENEQLTYILEGALQVLDRRGRVAGSASCSAGEVLHIPSNVSAQGRSARGHARRRHLRSAAPGLAEQDRLLSAEIADGSRSARKGRAGRGGEPRPRPRDRARAGARKARRSCICARGRDDARSGAQARSRRARGAERARGRRGRARTPSSVERVAERRAGEVRSGRHARHQRRRSAGGPFETHDWDAWERRGRISRCAARWS